MVSPDGVVNMFDKRLEEDNVIVRTYADPTSQVQNSRWHTLPCVGSPSILPAPICVVLNQNPVHLLE